MSAIPVGVPPSADNLREDIKALGDEVKDCRRTGDRDYEEELLERIQELEEQLEKTEQSQKKSFARPTRRLAIRELHIIHRILSQ